jgi:hypothetical protein
MMMEGLNMQRFFLTLITLFIVFVIIYDFKSGTLPTTFGSEQTFVENNSIEQEQQENEQLSDTEKTRPKSDDSNFIEVEVSPGSTVLSIVENVNNGQVPVSINQIIADFELLNPEAETNRLQIGEVYKFPLYKQ